jgi:hypothetical protein
VKWLNHVQLNSDRERRNSLIKTDENLQLKICYSCTGKISRKVNFFSFFLIFFGGTEVPIILHFSSAAPQRTAYREVPSQMAAHLRTGSPL